MKKSELRSLIREQVKAILKENDSRGFVGNSSGRFADDDDEEDYDNSDDWMDYPSPTNVDPNKFIDNYIVNGSKGHLDLRKLKISTFPSKIKKVGGHLFINKEMTSLPDGLKIGGNLNLGFGGVKEKATIKKLPNNLFVGGNIFAVGCTALESIGKNVTVNGNVFLDSTSISELPKDFKIKGELSIYKTPFQQNITGKSKKDVIKMSPEINKIMLAFFDLKE